MPSPKSGTAGNLVSPAAPKAAQDADDADPGQVEETKARERQMQSGKYGSTKVKPFKPEPEKTGWIEIELVDEDDKPVPGERYAVTLPDGETVADGTLDSNGFARIDGIDSGVCRITFPRLDKSAWSSA